jgi:hypothetical protein
VVVIWQQINTTEGKKMNDALSKAQDRYDHMLAPKHEDIPDWLSGTVDLQPSKEYALDVACRIEFTKGQVTAMWLCSCVSGNWHPFPIEAADCIGESYFYQPYAYGKLFSEWVASCAD